MSSWTPCLPSWQATPPSSARSNFCRFMLMLSRFSDRCIFQGTNVFTDTDPFLNQLNKNIQVCFAVFLFWDYSLGKSVNQLKGVKTTITGHFLRIELVTPVIKEMGTLAQNSPGAPFAKRLAFLMLMSLDTPCRCGSVTKLYKPGSFMSRSPIFANCCRLTLSRCESTTNRNRSSFSCCHETVFKIFKISFGFLL